MLLKMAEFHSFLWLSNIALCVRACVCIYIYTHKYIYKSSHHKKKTVTRLTVVIILQYIQISNHFVPPKWIQCYMLIIPQLKKNFFLKCKFTPSGHFAMSFLVDTTGRNEVLLASSELEAGVLLNILQSTRQSPTTKNSTAQNIKVLPLRNPRMCQDFFFELTHS